MKSQVLQTVWREYFCWGCRGNLTLITLRSERVNISTNRFQFQLVIVPRLSPWEGWYCKSTNQSARLPVWCFRSIRRVEGTMTLTDLDYFWTKMVIRRARRNGSVQREHCWGGCLFIRLAIAEPCAPRFAIVGGCISRQVSYRLPQIFSFLYI